MFRRTIRPFLCEFYTDGRIHIEPLPKPSLYERGIIFMLENRAKEGQFKLVEPGRYRVISKNERGHFSLDLIPID